MPRKKKSSSGKRYTPAQKALILKTAAAEKLTAAAVQKRFGVSALTFYRWRGPVRRRRGPGRPKGSKNRKALAPQVSSWLGQAQGTLRQQVRSSLRSIMPELIGQEIQSYLREMFGGGSASTNGHRTRVRRRRRRRRAVAAIAAVPAKATRGRRRPGRPRKVTAK